MIPNPTMPPTTPPTTAPTAPATTGGGRAAVTKPCKNAASQLCILTVADQSLIPELLLHGMSDPHCSWRITLFFVVLSLSCREVTGLDNLAFAFAALGRSKMRCHFPCDDAHHRGISRGKCRPKCRPEPRQQSMAIRWIRRKGWLRSGRRSRSRSWSLSCKKP